MNPLDAAKRMQVDKLSQLIDVLGWYVMDPTLPAEVNAYALSRLGALLQYLEARSQGD